MTTNMIDHALAYARRGWAVLPVKANKAPYSEHGALDATTDTAQIRQWWQRWPRANIGLAADASQLVIIDIDTKDGVDGWESWRDLLDELGLAEPETLYCETPTKGGHAYFATSETFSGKVGKLGPGLDIRSYHNYVIAPPSVHPNGGVYGWAMNADLDNIAPLPEPLAQRLRATKTDQNVPPERGEGIPEGERNSTLASIAGKLRQSGLDADAIGAALLGVNATQCRPPLPEREVLAIAKSIARYAPDSGTLSDLWNARRFVARHGQDTLYCDGLGGWLVWNGQRWTPDRTGQVERYAKETVTSIYAEAATVSDPDRRAALGKHAAKSENVQRIKAMIELARTEPGMMVTADQFDADPWLLNCDNGTLDLRTGTLRDHDRADMITKLAPVAYDSDAKHATLDRYLATVTDGDADFERYLQRACGYSLTGKTDEECFFLALGPAATGKSTLVEAMLATLGDYGAKASFAAFLASKNIGGATPELVRLRGARFVAAVETASGNMLNEQLVKELTGGDSVTARALYHEPVTFKPQFKLWLAANDSPKLTDTDTGLWRRLQRLPFERELGPDERDPRVKATLCDEGRAALLAWAVQGCLAWRRDGLGTCEIVRQRTTELRADFDPLAEFFGGWCVFDRHAETPAQELRDAYEQWAHSMGARPISNREWGKRLEARGCESRRARRNGRQSRVWFGVGMLSDDVDDEQEAAQAASEPVAVTDVTDNCHFRQNSPMKENSRTLPQNAVCPSHASHLDALSDSERYYLAMADGKDGP